MTTVTSDKPFLYRLLDIKADSIQILLLLYPPIYTLWLLAIGKRLLQRQNKSDKTFTFFASGTFLFFTIYIFVAPLLRLFDVDISVTGQQALPIVLTIYFFWFATVGLLANITIKYERQSTPDTFYELADSIDYVKRFFAFYFWFFFFWSYQKKVNRFNR